MAMPRFLLRFRMAWQAFRLRPIVMGVAVHGGLAIQGDCIIHNTTIDGIPSRNIKAIHDGTDFVGSLEYVLVRKDDLPSALISVPLQ